ncbi:MAG: FAD/NAD(P)-binding protein, partial [Pseudomonas sp.]
RVISRVWDFDFAQLNAASGPVAIIGAGLTMVDIVIALRDAGYQGAITALSRNGWLPHTHDMRDAQLVTTAGTLAQAPQRLRTLFRTLRHEIRAASTQNVSWQTAMDHWRPHLPTLWSQMTADDRRHFLAKYFTLWGIHRHRMAPAIGARIAAERTGNTLEIRSGGARITAADDNGVDIGTTQGTAHFQWVFDCRGPGYNLMTSDNVLLKQMAHDGLLAADATGWGVAVEDDLKVAGQRGLYAIGPLAIGARLETTAVPELRGQAKAIAHTLVAA